MWISIGDSKDPKTWPEFARILYRQNLEILTNQRNLMSQNEEILTEVDDLQAAVAVINGGVDTLDSNLEAALGRISELESAGVAPTTVAALRRAVDGAQGVADRFKAAVDPAQPTPTDEVPPPVENVPTDPTEGTPADSAPADGVEPSTDAPADSGVVADSGDQPVS